MSFLVVNVGFLNVLMSAWLEELFEVVGEGGLLEYLFN